MFSWDAWNLLECWDSVRHTTGPPHSHMCCHPHLMYTPNLGFTLGMRVAMKWGNSRCSYTCGVGYGPSLWCKICRVGQGHIYTVYIWCFWQGNHQIYGHVRCKYRNTRFWPTLKICVFSALVGSFYGAWYRSVASFPSLMWEWFSLPVLCFPRGGGGDLRKYIHGSTAPLEKFNIVWSTCAPPPPLKKI